MVILCTILYSPNVYTLNKNIKQSKEKVIQNKILFKNNNIIMFEVLHILRVATAAFGKVQVADIVYYSQSSLSG